MSKHSKGGSLQLLLNVQKSKQRRGLSPTALSGDNSFTLADLEMVQAYNGRCQAQSIRPLEKEEKKKKKNVGCCPLALPCRSYKWKEIRELLKG